MPLNENQQVGNYRILRKLGEGGMGAVYEARHEQLEKRAAIKVLHPQFSQDAEVSARFLNEGRAVNLVSHPGLVNVFECGRLEDGALYIVMEYLDGEPLSRRVAAGPLPVMDAARIARQAALALQAAHQKGIVHRDLKPDNLMLVPDPEAAGGERVKVLDFGVAKVTGAGDKVRTKTGVVMGTPIYMSPEQCHGAAQVDGQSDVYALGIILYEMLGGAVPFDSDGTGLIMAKHIYEAPPPLAARNPAVPAPLAALVHAMLAKAPAERPTMAQVAAELARLGAPRTGALDVSALLAPAAATTAAAAAPPVPAPAAFARTALEVRQAALPAASDGPAPPDVSSKPRPAREPESVRLERSAAESQAAPPYDGGQGHRSGRTDLGDANGCSPADPAAPADRDGRRSDRAPDIPSTPALAPAQPAAPLPPLTHAGPASAPGPNPLITAAPAAQRQHRRLLSLIGAAALLAGAGAGALLLRPSPGRVALTVKRQGLGTVISDPPGIYCGDLCTISLPAGTLVKLTVRPESGTRFAGWGDACTGAGACGLYLSRPQTVTARFIPR